MTQLDPREWRGLEALDADSLLGEMRADAERAVRDALLLFQSEIKRTLTGARGGRAYRVSKTGKLHIASAPGEPPAVLSGALRNSVGFSGPKWEGYTVQGEVGPGLGQAPEGGEPDPGDAYARRMELGGVSTHSRGGSSWTVRILPRPYMAPTADKVEPRIEELFRKRMGT